MPGYKSSWTGTLQNSDILDYLMKQSIMVFSTTAARDTALSGETRDGMYCYVSGTDTMYRHDGSSWITWTSPWTTVTPTFNNLTVGDGTLTGEYRYINGDMRYRGRIVWGSTTSMSSAVTVNIPNSETASAVVSLGAAYARDDSALADYSGVTRTLGAVTQIAVYAYADNISPTAPFTWGSGDVMAWDITIAL